MFQNFEPTPAENIHCLPGRWNPAGSRRSQGCGRRETKKERML